MSIRESTLWLAVGASALAALAVCAAAWLALRLSGEAAAPGDGDADAALRRARAEAERVRSELRRVRALAGAAGSLDELLRRALETATELGGGSGALLALPGAGGEPLVAAFGLTAEEASREPPALPEAAGARAVTLAFRYGDDERARDDFRITGGVAVGVHGAAGERLATLAVFRRRVERDATDEEVAALEGLAAALGPALAGALRADEWRRAADVDRDTGLPGGSSLERVLERECSRARRYERPLALLLLRATGPPAWTAARLRASVRAADAAHHLGAGTFAVLLPEASAADAERLARRLEPLLSAAAGAGARPGPVLAWTSLREADDPVSLRLRAEESLAAAATRADGARPARAAVERGP